MRLLVKRDNLFHHLSEPVLKTGHLNQLKQFKQHGHCTCYDHSVAVAKTALFLSMIFPFRFKQKQLVRGALLHDYFLYDWHIYDPERGHGHGFKHASIAAKRAAEDFSVTPLMAEMIKKHMWPLNLALPFHREAYILILADKVCSLRETFGKPYYYMVLDEIKGKA